MQKTTITGSLGNEATMSEANGKFVLNFSVAAKDVWRNKDGVKQETTTWYSSAWWFNEKPKIAEFLKKGVNVLIEGKYEPKIYNSKLNNEPMLDHVLRVATLEITSKKES